MSTKRAAASPHDLPADTSATLDMGAVLRGTLLSFSTFVLVGFLVLVATTLSEKRNQAIQEAARTRENLTRTLEQYVSGRVHEVEVILDDTADDLDEAARNGPLTPRTVLPLLRTQMRPDSPYRSLVVFDADGNRVVNADGNAEPFNASGRDYFKGLRDHPNRDFYISQPFVAKISGIWSLGVAHRLHKPDGSFGGLLLAPLNLSDIETFFASLDIGTHGNVTLWDEDAARVLARHPADPALLNRAFTVGPLYDLVRSGQAAGAFTSVSPLDGVNRMLTFRRVTDLPLVISVAQAEEDVLAEWRREFWTYGTGATFGVTVLLIMTTALWWQLYRQDRLVRALRTSEAAMRDTNVSLHKATAAAEAASRAKSEFLACMSHELRTPLNAVIGFSDMIATGAQQDPARVRGYAADIRASGLHLLRIITDILEMSRIEGGALELREESVDVAAVIAGSLRQVEPQAAQAGVTLRSATTGPLPRLRADEKRLMQVLLNLLSNGVKFTESGGTVSVEVDTTAEGGLAIVIADTGIGMTPAELAIAMEPFRQVDSRLSRRYDGAGLGLPLAKAFVELQGGNLTLASAPGKGTSARIFFPRSRLASITVPERQTAPTAIGTGS